MQWQIIKFESKFNINQVYFIYQNTQQFIKTEERMHKVIIYSFVFVNLAMVVITALFLFVDSFRGQDRDLIFALILLVLLTGYLLCSIQLIILMKRKHHAEYLRKGNAMKITSVLMTLFFVFTILLDLSS